MDIVTQQPRNYIREFLTNFTNSSTKRAYKLDLENFFEFCDGRFTHPSELNISHFIAYRDYLLKENLTTATVNRKLYSLKSMMSWCVVNKLVVFNPLAELRFPKNSVTAPTLAFTDDEAVRLIDAPNVATFYGNNHRFMLVLLLNLGLRRSELVNIKLQDIYEDRGTNVLRIVGKGGKLRVIPLTDHLFKELYRYLCQYQALTELVLESSDYLFQAYPNKRCPKPVNPNTIFKIVTRYAKQIGLTKRVSPHSCRATVISHLLENNVSPRAVADLAGHSDISTTINHYDAKRDGLKNSAAYKVDYKKD